KIYNLLLVRTYLRKSLGDFLFRFYLLNLVLQKCNKPYIKRWHSLKNRGSNHKSLLVILRKSLFFLNNTIYKLKKIFRLTKAMDNNSENLINNNIINYLNYYIKIDNPQFTVLLNGKWGSGKTHFIKKQIKEWTETSPTTDNEDEINLKPIYISLYGVREKSEIIIKIKEVLNPLLYSKTAKVVKSILFGAIKTVTSINLDTDGDGKSDGKMSFNIDSLGILKSANDKIKGNKILIFDDLERCQIELNELFGYINEFVEHFSCNVILIADETKLKDLEETNTKYKEFKEKLIGQTFTIEPDLNSAIEEFITKLKSDNSSSFFIEEKNIINDIFIASGVENLRILKQSILDFERFIEQFESDVYNHPKYKEFLKNLLGHFLLVYLEYKSGNQEISKRKLLLFTEEEKEKINSIRSKYNQVLDKHNLYQNSIVIEYGNITDFITNGFSDKDLLNESIKSNIFFRNSEEKDWEKLWLWQLLSDADFDSIYQSVKSDFENKTTENVHVLLHITTILISLINEQIINLDSEQIIKSFKEQFHSILESNKNESFPFIRDHSWSKVYRMKGTDTFNELVSFCNEKIRTHNSETTDDYVKSILENLNDENISSLQENLDKSTKDRQTVYYRTAIFSIVNGEVLANKLLLLSNYNLDIFFSYLKRRYFPEEIYSNGVLEPFVLDDKECLISLKETLEKKLEDLPKIKKFNMKININLLTVIIEKLEKLTKEQTEE
ncbi:P-loop NTPase fold protein, partial [Tenacibaculum finnmarkense]